MWDLQRDTFTFQITIPERPYTRRAVLAVVNSIYDPLGFVTPVTLQGRLLLRELTEMGNKARSKNSNEIHLDWDDPLPQHLRSKWSCWKKSLRELEGIQIPRCYRPDLFGEAEKSEIHTFSDASDKAIGVAVYLKKTNHQGEIAISLLFAQARLSPKQATTVPRLELFAAVLSAQAVKWINHELCLNVDESCSTQIPEWC